MPLNQSAPGNILTALYAHFEARIQVPDYDYRLGYNRDHGEPVLALNLLTDLICEHDIEMAAADLELLQKTHATFETTIDPLELAYMRKHCLRA